MECATSTCRCLHGSHTSLCTNMAPTARRLQEKYQLMLQDWLKLPPGERKPVHLKDNISMVVYDSSSGLLFVAYTLENMQPLQIIEALKAITTCLHSAFGGLSEEKACSIV